MYVGQMCVCVCCRCALMFCAHYRLLALPLMCTHCRPPLLNCPRLSSLAECRLQIVNAEFRRLSGVADAIATPSRYETVGSELARLSNLPEAARAEIHSSTDHEVRRLSSLPNAAAHRVAEHVDHELARLSGLPRASVTPVGSQAESFVTETQRLGGLAELFVDRKPAVKPAAILAKVRAENARRIAGAKIVGKVGVSCHVPAPVHAHEHELCSQLHFASLIACIAHRVLTSLIP